MRTLLAILTIAASFSLANVAGAAEPSKTDAVVEDRVQALIPDIETYIATGMKGFDVPGFVNRCQRQLICAKGFGARSKGGGEAVDTRTIFQIGSAKGISRYHNRHHG